MRSGIVYRGGVQAGLLEETDEGYRFTYNSEYLLDSTALAVSLTLPKRSAPFTAEALFPFFFGLLAEGSTKALQCRALKLDENDHFGRLLKTAHADVVGCVTVEEIESP